MGERVAVVFPGIGYHTDKPLLYYSKRLAAKRGYETIDVPYGGFAPDVKGSKEKMEEAYRSALAQAEELLKKVEWEGRKDILFLSKSVGTAVAAAYAKEHGLRTRNIYYTPVEASFSLMSDPGIVFSGTADSWVDPDAVRRACELRGFPLHVIADANHSLETGDVRRDVENLLTVMEITDAYIGGDFSFHFAGDVVE